MFSTVDLPLSTTTIIISSHAIAFAQLAVTALWSRTRKRAEALAGRLEQSGLRVYDYWQDLIEQSGVDVISIATPPLLRQDPLVRALARGCHVLVEKPISVGVAEAQTIVQAAQSAKTMTATSFNWRYAPAYQVAWRAIQEGVIGAIRDIRSEWLARATTSDFFAARPWIARMDIANGALGEGLSHDFDKARFLTGSEFKRIVIGVIRLTIKQDDNYVLDGGRSLHLAELSNGVLCDFYITPTAGQGNWRFTLLGDEGSLAINNGRQTVTRQRADDDQPIIMAIPESDQIIAGVELMQHTWSRLIADFVHAIRHGDAERRTVPHLPTLLDGLRTEEVIAAARASNESKHWVEIN